MPLGFDFTSGYAAVIYVLGGLLVVVAALEKLYGWTHWVRRRFFLGPEPSERAPEAPIIVLGAPGYSYSKVTINERQLTQIPYITRLDPSYLIENKEAAVTVTDVTTGVRRKDDGREHEFENFRAPALAPLEKAPVGNVSIPKDLFDGLTEQDYQGAFVFWVRFRAHGGTRWEVSYDPSTQEHARAEV